MTSCENDKKIVSKHWNICALPTCSHLPKTTSDQRRPDLPTWFCLKMMHVYYYSLGVGGGGGGGIEGNGPPFMAINYLAPGGGCEVLFSPGLSACVSVCPANILIFYFSATRRDIDLKLIQDTYRVVLD